jgi:NAD(P)-dependent dehydrogenase (short-subunit alcohol dehydrogenase family)
LGARSTALIQVNAIGTLWLNNLLYPPMVERGADKIIFISSVGGGTTQVPGFRHADGMSKAAIAFLAKILAADLAQTGVDVYAISPGATDTPMFQASTLNDLSQDERAALIAALPKNRLINPSEIAEVALFLASPAGRVLHGAVLDASLGLGVHPGLLAKK